MKILSLEKALGFTPNVEAKAGASLRRITIDGSLLEKMLRHWRSLAPVDLPSLRALTRSTGKDARPALTLVLDLGDREAWICLEIRVAESALPDFSIFWPHCRWWQEELSTFGNLDFSQSEKMLGVTWRLS